MKYIPSLSSEERRLHLERTQVLWGGSFTTDERSRELNNWMTSFPETMMMSGLKKDNDLVASLKRYLIDVKVNGKKTKAVGLGSIFTHENHRKHGYAANLIEKVLEESAIQFDCEYSFLFSDIDISYYEKFGFQVFPAKNWTLPLDKIQQTSPCHFRKAETTDLPRLLEAYQKTIEKIPFHFIRNEKMWSFFQEINRIEENLILSDGKKDLAYVSLNKNLNERYLWLNEVLFFSEERDFLWPALRAYATSHGLLKLRSWDLPTYPAHPERDVQARKGAYPMLASLKKTPLYIDTVFYIAPPDHF